MKHVFVRLSTVAAVMLLAGCNSSSDKNNTAAAMAGDVELRLVQTTDIHANLLGFDYYQNKEDRKFGLSRTALLIKQARAESTNSLLLDNGDLIQGSPLADYVYSQEDMKTTLHPAVKVMNTLGYDAGNLGNHEFNYGLEFLADIMKGASFPLLNANVLTVDAENAKTGAAADFSKSHFTPYVILDREVTDSKGNKQTIKVGILGLTTPQIMLWDKRHLDGKVDTADMVAAAEHYIPQMREQGADIVLLLAHTGINANGQVDKMENAAYYLAKVDGVDALMLGHSHRNFPGDYANIDGIDNEKGTIHGVPAVMPGYWGNRLGIIDLTLTQRDGRWQVADSKTELRVIDSSEGSAVDQEAVDLVQETHDNTNKWLDAPLGKITKPLQSFFALVKDDPSVQIVNDAQRWYANQQRDNGVLTEEWPILSAAAPFRGGRNGPADYTWVPAGNVSLRNVSDLYIYPNTLQVVALDGAGVKEWLEMSAGQFNQITADTTAPQDLVNKSFPTYNYDVIDGITYQIDVSQPARYNKDGLKISDSERITNMTFNGAAVDLTQKFYVVTNNYRASGGGNFPGINSTAIVHEDPSETREVISQYLVKLTQDQPTGFEPYADNNWAFAPLPADSNVLVYSSPTAEAQALSGEQLQYLKTLGADDANYPGYGVYQVQ